MELLVSWFISSNFWLHDLFCFVFKHVFWNQIWRFLWKDCLSYVFLNTFLFMYSPFFCYFLRYCFLRDFYQAVFISWVLIWRFLPEFLPEIILLFLLSKVDYGQFLASVFRWRKLIFVCKCIRLQSYFFKPLIQKKAILLFSSSLVLCFLCRKTQRVSGLLTSRTGQAYGLWEGTREGLVPEAFAEQFLSFCLTFDWISFFIF